MKNFLYGALAMLVLFVGGYLVMQAREAESAAEVAEAEPPKETPVATLANVGTGGGQSGTLVFIVGENAVAKTLEAAAEAEAGGSTATVNMNADADPRPGPAATAAPTSSPTASTDYTPPSRVCVGGPYIVYFDSDSANVNSSAAETLNRVAQQYRLNCQGATVSLAGHTDEGDGRRQAVRLSERMAASVAQYLGSRGVPSGSISSEAFGRSQLQVQAVEGVSSPQNRRVEITFGR